MWDNGWKDEVIDRDESANKREGKQDSLKDT